MTEAQTFLAPHLVVGDGAAAIDFYVKAFGATEVGRVPGPDGKLMHAALTINGAPVYLNDDFPETCGGKAQTPKAFGGTPVTIHLQVPDVDAAYRRAIDAGATELMAPADMFWGDRYSQVEDPFGHHWSLAQTVREVGPEEIAAAMAAMGEQQ